MFERSETINFEPNSLLLAREAKAKVEAVLGKLWVFRGGLLTVPPDLQGMTLWWILATIMTTEAFSKLQDFYSDLGLFFKDVKWGEIMAHKDVIKDGEILWAGAKSWPIERYIHLNFETKPTWSTGNKAVDLFRLRLAYLAGLLYQISQTLLTTTQMPQPYRLKDLGTFLLTTSSRVNRPRGANGAALGTSGDLEKDMAVGCQISDWLILLSSLVTNRRDIDVGQVSEQVKALRVPFDLFNLTALTDLLSNFNDSGDVAGWRTYVRNKSAFCSIVNFMRSLMLIKKVVPPVTSSSGGSSMIKTTDAASHYGTFHAALSIWLYQDDLAELLSEGAVLTNKMFTTGIAKWQNEPVYKELMSRLEILKQYDLNKTWDRTNASYSPIDGVFFKGVPTTVVALPKWVQTDFGLASDTDAASIKDAFFNEGRIIYDSVKDHYYFKCPDSKGYKTYIGDPTNRKLTLADPTSRDKWLSVLHQKYVDLLQRVNSFMKTPQFIQLASGEQPIVQTRLKEYISEVQNLSDPLPYKVGPLGVSAVTSPIFSDVTVIEGTDAPDNINELVKSNIFNVLKLDEHGSVSSLTDKMIWRNFTLRSSVDLLSEHTYNRQFTTSYVDGGETKTETYRLPQFITQIIRSNVAIPPRWLWPSNFWCVNSDVWGTTGSGAEMSLFGLYRLLGFKTFDDFRVAIESKIPAMTKEEWAGFDSSVTKSKWLYLTSLAHCLETIGVLMVKKPDKDIAEALKVIDINKDDFDNKGTLSEALKVKINAIFGCWNMVGIKKNSLSLTDTKVNHRPYGINFKFIDILKCIDGASPIALDKSLGLYLWPYARLPYPPDIENTTISAAPDWGYEISAHQLRISDDKVTALADLTKGKVLTGDWDFNNLTPVKGWVMGDTVHTLISLVAFTTGRRYTQPWYGVLQPVEADGILIWRRNYLVIDDGLVAHQSRHIIPDEKFIITADMIALADRKPIDGALSLILDVNENDL